MKELDVLLGSDFAGNQKDLKKVKMETLLFIKAPENDNDVSPGDSWVVLCKLCGVY